MDVPSHPFVMYHPCAGHLGCFQFLLILGRAAINIHVRVIVLCKHKFSFSREEFLNLGTVDIWGQILLYLMRAALCFVGCFEKYPWPLFTRCP